MFQKSFHRQFLSPKTEAFFHFINEQITYAMEEIKASISMSTDGATHKRDDERDNEKSKDPMSRRDTISLLKKDTQDSHVVGTA